VFCAVFASPLRRWRHRRVSRGVGGGYLASTKLLPSPTRIGRSVVPLSGRYRPARRSTAASDRRRRWHRSAGSTCRSTGWQSVEGKLSAVAERQTVADIEHVARRPQLVSAAP
jgi:hypothetical protein